MLRLKSIALAAFALGFSAIPGVADDIRTSLMRAGLSPEALTAAGVTSNQIEGIVSDVEASDAWTGHALATADAAYAAAREDVDRLSRVVSSGTGTEQDVTDLAAAKTALASAETAQASALIALFTAGKADLAGGTQTKLATLRGNLGRDVPTEFLAITRTDDQWLRLGKLLAHERVCAKTGEDPDEDAAVELAELRADTAVSAAKAYLDSNLPSVTAAWNTATAE